MIATEPRPDRTALRADSGRAEAPTPHARPTEARPSGPARVLILGDADGPMARRAEAELGQARALIADLSRALDSAHARAEAAAGRERAARSAMLAAQAELLDRDRQFLAMADELLAHRDAREAEVVRREAEIEARVAHVEALREALEAWHARSEAEFENSKAALVIQRDAAHQHALAAETRCRSLENRVEHVLMEVPRRVLRAIRARGKRRPAESPSSES